MQYVLGGRPGGCIACEALAGGVNEAGLGELVDLLFTRKHIVSLMVQPLAFAGRGRAFAATMQRRRTVRQFSARPVSRAVILACLEAAGTAPSGVS